MLKAFQYQHSFHYNNSACSPATGMYICSSTDQLSHRAVGLTDNTAVIHRTQYNSSTNTWQHTVATSNKHAAVHGIQYMKQQCSQAQNSSAHSTQQHVTFTK